MFKEKYFFSFDDLISIYLGNELNEPTEMFGMGKDILGTS